MVLCQRDVREAFEAERNGGRSREPGVAAASPARLSRTAIIGACWPVLFLFTMLLLFIQANTHQGPTSRLMILIWPFLLAAIPAPFGSTLLGWIAVSQIRRSSDRIYGLGLAVFDGLLFPLLALDATIIGFSVAACRFLSHSLHLSRGLAPLVILLLIGLSVVAAIVLDVWLIRRVWRAVNQPAKGPPAGWGLFWKTATAVFLVTVVLVAVLPFLWFAAWKVKVPNRYEELPSIPRRTITAPFIGNFSRGTVELLALAPHPSTNGPAWYPDGTLSDEPFPEFDARNWADGKLMREIAFKIHSRAGKPSSPVVRFSPESGVFGMGASSKWDDRNPATLTFVQAIACPPGVAITHI